MKDIIVAIVVLFIVALLLGLFHEKVLADEWFPEAAVYADITRDEDQLYCMRENGHASHLGARVGIWRQGPHMLRVLWIHNSCAEEDDDRTTRDVLGVGYEYRLW